MADQMAPPAAQDSGARAARRQRLATALMGYRHLAATVREDSPAPCLAVRNTAIPELPETVAITRLGDCLVFAWSWGDRVGDASDPDRAAQAIAYVLHARGARLGAAG